MVFNRKERVRQYQKRYYLEHKEIIKQRNRGKKRHSGNFCECGKELARGAGNLCRECYMGHAVDKLYDNFCRVRYRCIIARAKKKHISVTFTWKEFENWFVEQPLKCHYCGSDLIKSATRKEQSPFDLTIDRRDNIDYTLDNIVMACKRCNLIKTDIFTEQEMTEIATKYDLKSRD